ncbi:DUF58 domain-containing protein [Natronomonas sp. EA1]|uniref:DUF58 domain-containing protein n=1 Tax=Natronomonas sp. EA1 TaxID=3421655 RepID=UPI003EBD2788
MYVTRHYWQTATLGGALAVAGVVLSRPELLVGTAGIGAWLLSTQLLAGRRFARTDDALSVSLVADRDRVLVDHPIGWTLRVEAAAPLPAPVDVRAALPLPARLEDGDRHLTLAAGETAAETHFTARLTVAGRFEVPEPTVTLREGNYYEELERGTTPTLTVEPAAPRELHVGEGGERIAAYGVHTTGRQGTGLDPSELREYVAGDPADRIDWKATARLGAPYVREFDIETDRQTLLVVDHRGRLDVGPAGETMLAYATEVALGLANATSAADDPLGLYAVGDEGLTVRMPPGTTTEHYDRLRTHIRELEPTAGRMATDAVGRPDEARALQRALDGDDAFAARLRPFLTDSTAYVERLGADPLFDAIRSAQTRVPGSTWTVIITDDGDRAQVREAARLAARGDDGVAVFLLPRVLFAPETDPDETYREYVAFEEFRRELARLPGVTAFEVGPGDRLDRVLAAAPTS